ncbi:MAG: hypothetical protein WDN02_14525 [Methylovirgula sp.]|uniref:hypothetical protein n=1 Tax=Methylovirgula sp. TaxID=1978224 RepID=UPI0030763002
MSVPSKASALTQSKFQRDQARRLACGMQLAAWKRIPCATPARSAAVSAIGVQCAQLIGAGGIPERLEIT